MTPAQLAILKPWLLANAAALTDAEAAATLNALATPDYWVWRTAVTRAEALDETSGDGTVFVWSGVGYITRGQGERDAFQQLFSTGVINPARPTVRQAFQDIFSGTGNAALNRTHLATVARRRATLAEKLLATGTGSTATPATLSFEGLATAQDVVDAYRSA